MPRKKKSLADMTDAEVYEEEIRQETDIWKRAQTRRAKGVAPGTRIYFNGRHGKKRVESSIHLYKERPEFSDYGSFDTPEPEYSPSDVYLDGVTLSVLRFGFGNIESAKKAIPQIRAHIEGLLGKIDHTQAIASLSISEQLGEVVVRADSETVYYNDFFHKFLKVYSADANERFFGRQEDEEAV